MLGKGRIVLLIVLFPVVLLMAFLGIGIAAFATGAPGGGTAAALLLGLGLVLSAGVVLGVVLRPLPATSRRTAIVVGTVFLATGGSALLCAVALPGVSSALRSGLLAPLFLPLFSPLGLALTVVLGTALLVASLTGRTSPGRVTPLRHSGPRDPPPG